VDLPGDPRLNCARLLARVIYLSAWQLQLALFAFGANDGWSTPTVISATAAIFSIVSIVPSEPD